MPLLVLVILIQFFGTAYVLNQYHQNYTELQQQLSECRANYPEVKK